jgi:recombination protein RecR
MKFSSQLIEKSVESFNSLPGIGRKTALRLTLHLINKDPDWVRKFSDAFVKLRDGLRECSVCHNLGDEEVCAICSNAKRDEGTICVVESIRDLMAIEETNLYNGKYHVLGGLISPIDGIGPDDLNLDDLYERITKQSTCEIIMAISPNIEGETTMYYISKKMQDLDVKITTIARGISFGGDLEYADEVTLGRSIVSRVPYQQYSTVAG